MAGEAKTAQFLLSDATVMIGPVADLMNLNPDEHSIGLVKNFSITGEPSYTALTQGVKNEEVYSVMTDNPITASMEVYEFTSKNIAYGLGLDGADFTLETPASYAISADADTADTAVDISSPTDISSKFPTGCWVSLQSADPDKADHVHIAQVSSVSYTDTTLTVNFVGYPLPEDFKTGAKLTRVVDIPVGSKDNQPFLSAKIVGILPESNQPITILIPKLRVTKGFTLAFQSDNYGNLPYEFKPYAQVATDPNYSKFGTKRAVVFRA